jgi:7-carboxy-7-deazaguanine synthase
LNGEKKYPIAEIFTSPQGEGVYTGTLMCFVRLAGCCVGKRFPKEMYEPRDEQTFVGLETMPSKLPIYTECCTLYDGRQFECDTDYRMKEQLTLNDIVQRIGDVAHVCITGGEPFIHDLRGIVGTLMNHGYEVHIETSGTVPLEKAFGEGHSWTEQESWITVSPKQGVLVEMISRADEIKLLVDENFDIAKLPEAVALARIVYLQPVNYEHTINMDNLRRCLRLQKEHPRWRVSVQMHKVMGVR